MIERVTSTIYSSMVAFPDVARRNKITLKAVLILGVLGIFLCTAYYLDKSRILPPKPPIDDKKVDVPPSKPSIKQIRLEKLKRLVQGQLLQNQYLGEANDNGDCFYDALSKSLAQMGIQADPKDLREVIAKHLVDSAHQQQMREDIEADPRGVDSFDNYKKYVCYTNDEMIALNKKSSETPAASYWGSAEREGIILCHALQFNLRVVSAGYLESEISNDKEYTELSEKKDEDLASYPPDAPIHEYNEENIRARLIALYGQDKFYYVGEGTNYPQEAPYTKTCTLALFENHYIPVLTT